MTDPVIARRCPWCGVSIREQAFFCPQCGKDLTPQQPDFSATIAESAPPQPTGRTTADLVEEPRPKESPREAPPLETAPEAAPEKNRKGPIGKQALGKMGAGIQRATHAARDVEGNVVHRVQKLRDASSVVIDEAAYDASLRFVLVAAVLFILFLVILLLSKLIT